MFARRSYKNVDTRATMPGLSRQEINMRPSTVCKRTPSSTLCMRYVQYSANLRKLTKFGAPGYNEYDLRTLRTGGGCVGERGCDEHVALVEALLRRVAAKVRKHGRAILVDFAVTPAQFDALLHIDRVPGLTIGDLTAHLGLAYSTTTDLVDRLQQRGYAERLRDPDDKRVVRVRALPDGLAVIRRVMETRREYLARILNHIEAEDRKQILTSLQLLEQHLHEG